MTDLDFARIDHDRRERTGISEAVYTPGKTTEQCVQIIRTMLANACGPVLATRVGAEAAAEIAGVVSGADYDANARLLVWRPDAPRAGRVAVLCAGTADLPIADEAAGTLAAFGHGVDRFTDVGVAGIHRVIGVGADVAAADVIIVVAGMDGALASVVTGLHTAPVIAVPTSAGYGSSFEGITALLTMTSACAPGATIVGIDNGFGAACAAVRILRWTNQDASDDKG